MLGISDAWSMSPLSHRPSNPAYFNKDCRISKLNNGSYTLGLCTYITYIIVWRFLLFNTWICTFKKPTFCTWFDLDKFVVLKIPLDFTRFLEMVEDIFCFCFESSRGRTSADFPYYPLGFDICDVIGTKAYTLLKLPCLLSLLFCKHFANNLNTPFSNFSCRFPNPNKFFQFES